LAFHLQVLIMQISKSWDNFNNAVATADL
jgi:hypothetical protein